MSMLVAHVKKHTGKPYRVGTLVAVKGNEDNKVFIACAKCKVKMDRFSALVGVETAMDRIELMEKDGNRLHIDAPGQRFPHSMREATERFIIRAMRYFKTDNIQVFRWRDEDVADVIAEWKSAKVVA